MHEYFFFENPALKRWHTSNTNGGCMFLSTYELEHGRHVARLLHRRCRRRRAYAPTSNTASHDTHEKIYSWVSFCSLIWVWGPAWRPSAAGAPLLIWWSEEVIRSLMACNGGNCLKFGRSVARRRNVTRETTAWLFILEWSGVGNPITFWVYLYISSLHVFISQCVLKSLSSGRYRWVLCAIFFA